MRCKNCNCRCALDGALAVDATAILLAIAQKDALRCIA